MAETVNVYVNVRENGTLSISVDIPVDLIHKIHETESGIDEDKLIQKLAHNWMGDVIPQPEHKTI